MRLASLALLPGSLLLLACGGVPVAAPATPPPAESASAESASAAREAIARVLDDWHDAAARADEERYFGHLSEDAVFLGTDASERWDRAAFRAYAHPHFSKGKAWSFKALRRAITVDPGGTLAWFDEDLDAPNLGPARGSGVLARRGTSWMIRQYNLAITVPNERFDEVKGLLAGKSLPLAKPGCSSSAP